MNRCCLTCEWFRGGECVCEEMRTNLEDILETIEDDEEFDRIADIFDDEFSDIFYDED